MNMNPKFTPLFAPYTFNNGVLVRNRLAIAPMTHWASDAQGHVTPSELAYIEARAYGFGLFISAAIAVNREGIAFTGQPVAFSEEDLSSLSHMARSMKSQGALAIAQLQHGGAAALTELNGGVAYAPSKLEGQEVDTAIKVTATTEALSPEGIASLIADFARAAELVLRAGFDGVELHGANGYLLQQFFSAKTNKREDAWGGSLEKRMALPLAIVDAVLDVRVRYGRPDFIVGYRLTPEEAGAEGLTMGQTLRLIKSLSGKGLQYIHMSLQGYGNKARREADTTKTRLALTKECLEGSGVALIGVGGLRTPDQALEAYNTQTADIVAIGMGVLVNPDFVRLIERGEERKARKTPNIFRDAAYHQLPQPMWDMMMTFVPKPILGFATFVGRLLGWK